MVAGRLTAPWRSTGLSKAAEGTSIHCGENRNYQHRQEPKAIISETNHNLIKRTFTHTVTSGKNMN
jgi:hypothetical protein